MLLRLPSYACDTTLIRLQAIDMQEGHTSIRVTLRQPTAIPKSRRRHLSDLAPFCAVQRSRGSPLHGCCLGAVIEGNSAVCRTVLGEVLWLILEQTPVAGDSLGTQDAACASCARPVDARQRTRARCIREWLQAAIYRRSTRVA